jgi:hypothetical protein
MRFFNYFYHLKEIYIIILTLTQPNVRPSQLPFHFATDFFNKKILEKKFNLENHCLIFYH